jgi:hypothetical protein
LALSLSIVFLSSIIEAAEISPSQANYLQDLQAKAVELQLAETREWHLLLHYEPRWFGGYKSEADGKNFFQAPNGKYNPQAELRASLAAFFRPAVLDAAISEQESQHPQCLYIARYRFLQSALQFDPQLLPQQPCERFEKWRSGLVGDGNDVSMTLIFAAYFLNNPASMFGHTLLRINRPRTQSLPLLDYAVNFAANTGTDGGMMFMILGLLGGYPGAFANYPYYFKVQQYSNIDQRDIWEYPLKLNQQEIDRLLTYLWESGSTYFNYFFFDENCSYHLLSLLEYARPNLELRHHFFFLTPPADTVKLITQQPELVDAPIYRPSRYSQLRRRFSQLEKPTQKFFFKLRHQQSFDLDEEDHLPQWQSLPTEQKALLADTLIADAERSSRKSDEEVKGAPELKRKQLLSWRSKLGEAPESPPRHALLDATTPLPPRRRSLRGNFRV